MFALLVAHQPGAEPGRARRHCAHIAAYRTVSRRGLAVVFGNEIRDFGSGVEGVRGPFVN